MPSDFKTCYERLGLSQAADWRTVQTTYRQLMIRWHPDRHRENQVSHDYAKQHFIDLTTAFNELRDFHREHNRLPLQEKNADSTSAVSAGASANPSSKTRNPPKPGSQSPRRSNRPPPSFELSDEQLMDASLVKVASKPALKDRIAEIRGNKPAMSAIALVLLLLLVFVLFVVLDSTNSQWRQNEAKRIVIESGPSEFVRPAEEILRGRTKY